MFVQTGASTSYIRITPLSQIGIAAGSLALVSWLALSTTVTVIEYLTASDRVAQVRVLQDAYEARLGELAGERDRSLAEAQSAQDRFRLAMEQIGRQQTSLLEVVEERRELASSLDLMRNRLKHEVDAREQMIAAHDDLTAQASAATASLDQNRGSADDLARTLDTISTALATAVVERDAAAADRAVLASAVSELELRMQMNVKRQNEMLDEIEQAVAMSFGPLQEMFGQSQVDVEELLTTVRGNFSGIGGPLGQATASSRNIDDGLSDRVGQVMLGLDRMNLMRIAAGRIPYAMPVTSSFRFTSGYGYRRDPKGGGRRLHRGIDLAGPRGTPIFSTADGVVMSAKFENGYGNTVRIQHDFGFETVYAHQSQLRVREGQQVSRGERIGDMGSTGRSTGVHLHYEVHLNGQPVNPMTYLEAARNVF